MTILTIGQTFAQTDKNGNPVFNSVSTGEKSIDNFVLISNYYTLKNNIENTQSSVFISEKPTLDQIEKASINLASDFFIMTKESKMVVMVMLKPSQFSDWHPGDYLNALLVFLFTGVFGNLIQFTGYIIHPFYLFLLLVDNLVYFPIP